MSHFRSIKLHYRQEGDTINDNDLKEQLQSLLSEKLKGEELKEFKNSGFKTTRPTRVSVVLSALYRKAAGGDMSAIKEVLSLLSDKTDVEKSEVTIIDNVGN